MARDTFFLLIAIALAIPLSVVANLLTPRLRDWWSHRSKKRLEDRIAQLEWQLKAPGPSFQEVTIVVARRLAVGLFCVAVLAAYGSTSIFAPYHLSFIVISVSLVTIIVLYITALAQFMSAIMEATDYLRGLPDSGAQLKMRKRIDRLKKALQKKKV